MQQPFESTERSRDRPDIGSSLPDFTFREASDSDFPGIEKLFEQKGNKPGWATWKYAKNPDGRARVFIAQDKRKKIVATLAYLPRRFVLADGSTMTVMLAVDILRDAELDGNLIYLGLLDFARRHVSKARIGVPNQFSRVFASGPGWRVLGRYENWHFPVVIAGLFDSSMVAFIAPLLNALSVFYGSVRLPGNHKSVDMRRISRFSRDFAPDTAANHGVRSADYLNWRFVDNPISEYHGYEFFDGDESIGYCVFTRSGATAILSDFVALRDRRVCMRRFVEHCRKTKTARVSYSGTQLGLEDMGFIRGKFALDCTAYELPEGDWVVTPCDIDSEPGRTTLATDQIP